MSSGPDRAKNPSDLVVMLVLARKPARNAGKTVIFFGCGSLSVYLGRESGRKSGRVGSRGDAGQSGSLRPNTRALHARTRENESRGKLVR